MNRAQRTPTRRWGRVVMVAIASLSALELILHLLAPLHTADAAHLYVYDAELGFRLRPSLNWVDETDHRREVITNARGTVNRQEDFDAYGQLIFAIGDSYTQGTGVAFDEAYPAQLDRALNLRDGTYEHRYGVVNLGLAAYGTEQATLTAQRFASSIGAPTHVLYLASPNDAVDDRLFASGYRHRHRVTGNPHHRLPAGLIHALEGTQLGRRMKMIVAGARRRELAESKAPERSWIESQSDALDVLRADTVKSGARLVVSYAGTDATYDALKLWARQHAVDFADWRGPALAAIGGDPQRHVHNAHSGGHFQPWVYTLIAEAFAQALQETAAPDAAGAP